MQPLRTFKVKGILLLVVVGTDFLTYHFVIDFMEMDLADFVDDILALKRDESKAWKKTHNISLIRLLYRIKNTWNILNGKSVCIVILSINNIISSSNSIN